MHSLQLVFSREGDVQQLETPVLRGREPKVDRELPMQSILLTGAKVVQGVAVRVDTKLQKIYGLRVRMTDWTQQEIIEEVKCLDTELKGEW